MFRKYGSVCLVLLFFSGIPALFNINSIDYDDVIDFSINLRELNLLIENDRENQLDKNKFYVLNGIYSNISPRIVGRNYFFYIDKDDLLNPSSFINLLKTGSTRLSVFINESLSEETLSMLNSASGTEEQLLTAVLDDIKALMKEQVIYSSSIFSGIPISEDLMEIININPQTAEEIAFLNRLLLEAAFPEEITPVQMEMELVYGEWIGTQDVVGYKCNLIVNGILSFRVFNRLNTQDSCSLMIPINSKIMVVAQPIRVVTNNGERMWLLEARFIRKI